ncbi:cupin domain-containing protein [Candidatus Methylacidiphilum infernorum]|uniref:Cupin domain-containing protein n=1 Tax=Candidatus Methylacidiphilum infernorum TaxID=511746 RepID=A0ABX7PU23_9BACT|nr:cupin domain-containing protein [Candidatus Methylacidiphilum infernorum]QSR86490.1 cupin domain-containing protein [Candidatus Methylacidiphilum infernorum]
MKDRLLVKDLDEKGFFIAGDGSLLNELFHPEKDNLPLSFSIAYGTVEPKKATKPHRLSQPEIYLFLSGEGSFKTASGDSYPVRAYSLVYVPPGCIQWVENGAAEPLRFICIVSPPWKAEWEKEEHL